MRHPSVLLIANAVYIQIDSDKPELSPKYVAASLHSGIFLGEVYTLDEIKERCKDSTYKLKETTLKDLGAAWNQPD